jgi:uncharacterized DUF497 family protein
MHFEWDEAQCRANIAKHGFDFRDALTLFDRPYRVTEASTVKGERRWYVTGLIGGVYATAVFTLRWNAIRVISLRRARRGEREEHRQIFGGGA